MPAVAILLLAFACAHCDSSDGADTPGEERTLANCATEIQGDVPAFFADHFRCVTMAMDGDVVVISTENLPPHRTYYYGAGHPNYAEFAQGRGDEFHANPNTLSATPFSLRIPPAPVARGITVSADRVDRTTGTDENEYRMGPAGLALDSVALFNDQAAPGDDIDDERFTFDVYDAHPAPGGEYHYHASSPGPLEVLEALDLAEGTTPGSSTLEVYGVMCDGTVVLGCTELDGGAVEAPALDAQSGHVHDLVDALGATAFAARYHVHVCPGADHPYTPEIQYYAECLVD
jgi:hypothetical protein